jgi:prepilin-type N-terminal cleavage/methylation domain-containing protein
MRTRQGFTLVELMVSVALMGVVIVWLMGFFVVQSRSYVVTDELGEAQQNSRTIIDLIEREIRAAGMMVPENGAACGVDSTTGPDTLYVGDADAIDPTNQNIPNLGAKVLAGVPLAAGANTLTVNSVVLDGSPYYVTTTPGVPSSDFRCDTGNCAVGGNNAAGGVILIDAANPGRGVACGTITSIPNNTTISVNFSNILNGAGGNAPNVLAIPAHVYTIDANNRLRRDNLILANDVEDLQVAYFYDVTPNGIVDSVATEYPGSSPALGGVQYLPQNWDGTRLREIRVNLVVRSRTPDPNLTGSQPQSTENRAAPLPADPAGQNYHRRVITSTVRLRNVGQRT